MSELSDDVRALFDAANYATVTSLNADGSPQASVIWVKTDGDDVVFSTVRGRRKARNFDRDPRTAVVVIDHTNPFRYAEVRGKVTVTEDPTGALIQELAHKYTGKPWTESRPDIERLIVRVIPEKVHLHG
ncbi:PPOX class F420-dependent oxidoreductase [Streptosporangium saharense]|uniref:PPOX class probable F420-dependent enzyme n=1 Tax=Streptosporangium saharense TaxID=1706840 RepID=A0A7W7QIL6_9ACTN|nr:PPOX class F420-dependent oxidoreductase [Streptosporangium saharense]MBB4913796.1 PPOX class probable F420-dependent enzyme [Streptosporangium saharense]